MLPVHFGPWQTVYGWFEELARRFLFQTIHDLALLSMIAARLLAAATRWVVIDKSRTTSPLCPP